MLNRREQDCDQNCHDPDYDQQFQQREGSVPCPFYCASQTSSKTVTE
jgi:hypothetical protein